MKVLISDLKKAETILSQYSGGYSGEHLSAEEFHKDLVDRISKLKKITLIRNNKHYGTD